jgi:hypothetical protein
LNEEHKQKLTTNVDTIITDEIKLYLLPGNRSDSAEHSLNSDIAIMIDTVNVIRNDMFQSN